MGEVEAPTLRPRAVLVKRMASAQESDIQTPRFSIWSLSRIFAYAHTTAIARTVPVVNRVTVQGARFGTAVGQPTAAGAGKAVSGRRMICQSLNASTY